MITDVTEGSLGSEGDEMSGTDFVSLVTELLTALQISLVSNKITAIAFTLSFSKVSCIYFQILENLPLKMSFSTCLLFWSLTCTVTFHTSIHEGHISFWGWYNITHRCQGRLTFYKINKMYPNIFHKIHKICQNTFPKVNEIYQKHIWFKRKYLFDATVFLFS